jgi:mttA/Hcf106 family
MIELVLLVGLGCSALDTYAILVFENLSLPRLLMVLAVAILVFGPKRIPQIAGSPARWGKAYASSTARARLRPIRTIGGSPSDSSTEVHP